MAYQFKPPAYKLKPWDGAHRRLSNLWRMFQGLSLDSEESWQAYRTLNICSIDARRAYFVISAYTAAYRTNQAIAGILNPMMADEEKPLYTSEDIERACNELYESGLIDQDRRPRWQWVMVEEE